MREFLTAYHTGKIEPMADFFDRHGTATDAAARRNRSIERALWVVGFVYPGVRRFVPVQVQESTADAIALIGRSAVSDAWYRFTIEVDPKPPYGVAFGFENAEPPGGYRERNPEIATYMRRVTDADFFSGAVMTANDGGTIYSGAFGLADHERNIANTLDTQINLGSANKMFTAVAIMQLVEQGRVQLDAAVGRYVPDYPNGDAADNVTVHHLLTHTSGVADYFNEKYMLRKKEIASVAELLPIFAGEPLAFRPGEKWMYSNGGYALLGRIIELVSGLSYEEYVQRNVFAPAGMTRTSGDAREPFARGYTFMRRGGTTGQMRVVNDFALPGTGSPAGGGYSTVGDLVAFARALRAGKLVTESSITRMLTPHATRDDGSWYGYGFAISKRNGHTVVGHNGHHFGISAQLDIHLEAGTIVAVLANYDPPAAPAVATRLGELDATRPRGARGQENRRGEQLDTPIVDHLPFPSPAGSGE